jgi:hypothetical protein
VTHMPIARPAFRAVRSTAVLLTLVAPLFVAGCAAVDQPQNGRVADSNGNSVPSTGAPAALSNGYPFGYW